MAEKNLELIRENNLKKLEDLLQEAIGLAASLDMDLDELVETLRLMAEEE